MFTQCRYHFISSQIQACLNRARLSFHFSVGRASQGRFLLPCSPQHIHRTSPRLQGDGSPRASGLPDAGVRLPHVVKERRQMSRGFPATADLLYISMCTKRLCRRRDEETERERRRPAGLKATRCPWGLKKLQRKAQTLYSNTSGGPVIFPARL